jgi:hypothetical protein
MKYFLFIFFILPMEVFSQSTNKYVDQYVVILNSLYKEMGNKGSEYIYYDYYINDSTSDSIMNKTIKERIRNNHIIPGTPEKSYIYVSLGAPQIQLDGSIVFVVPVGSYVEKEKSILIGGSNIYVFKRKDRKIRLISTVSTGI